MTHKHGRRKEVEAKSIGTIFNNIMSENSTNLEKEWLSRYRRSLGLQTDQKKTFLCHIRDKKLNIKRRTILKGAKEMC
jgi:hypothetical protein